MATNKPLDHTHKNFWSVHKETLAEYEATVEETPAEESTEESTEDKPKTTK